MCTEGLPLPGAQNSMGIALEHSSDSKFQCLPLHLLHPMLIAMPFAIQLRFWWRKGSFPAGSFTQAVPSVQFWSRHCVTADAVRANLNSVHLVCDSAPYHVCTMYSEHLGRDVLYPFGFGLSYTPLVCTYPVRKDNTDRKYMQCKLCNTCRLVAVASWYFVRSWWFFDFAHVDVQRHGFSSQDIWVQAWPKAGALWKSTPRIEYSNRREET